MKVAVLGGALRTHEGLRYIPVNARAMAYSVAAFSVARPGGWSPMPIRSSDARAFRKMTRGIETYVYLPPEVKPVPGPSWSERRRAYLGHLRAAAMLGARGVLIPPLRPVSNGADPTEAYLRELVARFYAAPLDDLKVDAVFRLGKPGVPSASLDFLTSAWRAMPCVRRCGFSFDLADQTLDWDDARIERAYAGWARGVHMIHVSSPREHLDGASGLFRRFAGACPFVLEHSSLTEQNEVSEWIRATCEDPDVFENIP